MCAKRIKFIMTRLSVCSLGVSCNEMTDTPMLLVVPFKAFLLLFSLCIVGVFLLRFSFDKFFFLWLWGAFFHHLKAFLLHFFLYVGVLFLFLWGSLFGLPPPPPTKILVGANACVYLNHYE